MKSYGVSSQTTVENAVDLHIENLKLKGFSVCNDFIEAAACDLYSERLENIYSEQERSFGRENLAAINEIDIARMPFMFNHSFCDLFMHPFILELAEKVIGTHFQLHLQNGVINRPQKIHHQTSWHRDLPYQDWTISKPLGFNAFYCLTDFTKDNGATFFLPYSHRSDHFPSNQFVSENEFCIEATKGSVVFFDSMIYHRAGFNKTENTRIGINNMFVVPILKQQIDITEFASLAAIPDEVKSKLGLNFKLDTTVDSYRKSKLKKKNG